MAYLGANIIQYFRLYKPLYADWFKIAVSNQSDAFIAQYSTLNSEICWTRWLLVFMRILAVRKTLKLWGNMTL